MRIRSANPTLPVVRRSRPNGAAFTLFELLVVLAILSILVTIAIPAVYQTAKKTPMRQATSEICEACQNARMLAILSGNITELMIKASDGTMQVQMASDVPQARAVGEGAETPGFDVGVGEGGDPEGTSGSGSPRPATQEITPFSSHLPSSVAFKRLVVNLQDLMEAPEVRVRFYPNGTSDALSVTLLSEQNEERVLTLEITTGRETVEVVR
jgi:prepilin-type N-terminal cleavage/methylation domain-containing protein